MVPMESGDYYTTDSTTKIEQIILGWQVDKVGPLLVINGVISYNPYK